MGVVEYRNFRIHVFARIGTGAYYAKCRSYAFPHVVLDTDYRESAEAVVEASKELIDWFLIDFENQGREK